MSSVEADRVTIMLDGDLNIRLRKLQAKRITETQATQSFSHILNQVLRGELKLIK